MAGPKPQRPTVYGNSNLWVRKVRALQQTKTSSCRRAGLPHKGAACELPNTCKGMFTFNTQTLNIDDMGPDERKVRAGRVRAGHGHGDLTGIWRMRRPWHLARPGSPVKALQKEAAREYLQRAKLLVREEGSRLPMASLCSNGFLNVGGGCCSPPSRRSCASVFP